MTTTSTTTPFGGWRDRATAERAATIAALTAKGLTARQITAHVGGSMRQVERFRAMSDRHGNRRTPLRYRQRIPTQRTGEPVSMTDREAVAELWRAVLDHAKRNKRSLRIVHAALRQVHELAPDADYVTLVRAAQRAEPLEGWAADAIDVYVALGGVLPEPVFVEDLTAVKEAA